MPVPSSEKRVHTHHGLYSITGAQRTVQTLTVPRSAWLLLRFVCGRRLVKGLDVHRDGGRPGRSRAHVGDEHVRALRVAGGKTPVGVERADEGGVTRVPVYATCRLRKSAGRTEASPDAATSSVQAVTRVRRGALRLRRHHQLNPEAAPGCAPVGDVGRGGGVYQRAGSTGPARFRHSAAPAIGRSRR